MFILAGDAGEFKVKLKAPDVLGGALIIFSAWLADRLRD
jgi:hypothetical protein